VLPWRETTKVACARSGAITNEMLRSPMPAWPVLIWPVLPGPVLTFLVLRQRGSRPADAQIPDRNPWPRDDRRGCQSRSIRPV
jgi:hypothetical protein